MNYTFYRAIGEPKETRVTECKPTRHVFQEKGGRCKCGMQDYEKMKKKATRSCDCGKPAIEFSEGSPICASCKKIQSEFRNYAR